MSGAFRIGVVGAGAIAQVVHLPLVSRLPGVTLAGVCDPDMAKARAVADRFGVDITCDDADDLFASDEVDGVIICSPNHLHEAQAIAALRAGKHVLVEKPLAFDAAGAERVLAEAERADATLMVALNNRYRPDVRALKPFLQHRELGDIFFMKAGWWNRKVRPSRPTWRQRPETAGGGALMDLGVQVLDLCLWTLDYPRVERITAHTHTEKGMEVEDSAALFVEVDDGPVLSIEVTWSLLAERDRHYLQLLGSHGSASVSPLVVKKEVEQGLIDVTPQIRQHQGNVYTASYRDQLRHFVAVSRGQEEMPLPHEQIELMRLTALAYQSADEGREVTA